MKTAIYRCLALWLWVCLGFCGGAAPAVVRPPNIVLILADDLGWGHLGSYGQTKIKTPQLDRLAAEGMRFTRAYAGSNVCAPSRSTLMTGLHTGHTPIRANGKKRHYHAADVTVAEVLQKAGYVTGGFGKWGGGTEDTPGAPWKQGFDEWFGQLSQVHAHFYYPYWVWHNDRRHPLPGNEGGKRGQYVHDEIHAQAKDFIRRHAGRPFFAYLPYILPHVELVVPADSEGGYRDQFPVKAIADPRPGYLGSEHAYATFAGMISRLDRDVGEVMALLRELKIEENTLVLFTSDNGAQGAAWQPLVDFFAGNGALRGNKGEFYEGGIRVPFIARWSGRIRSGVTTDHVCAFWDVLPTLAELAGAPVPPNLDGISFLPTLLGKGGQRQHDYLYWEYPASNGRLTQAIRQGDLKLVRARPTAEFELYDLAADPGERNNLAKSRPELVATLQARLAAARTDEREYPEENPKPGIADFVK